MAAPTTQASQVTFSSLAGTTATISWMRGNGSKVAVFVKATDTGASAPADSTTYTANTAWRSGTQISATGWYCVYNGTGTSVSVTALTAGTTFRAHACEYNGSAGAEQYKTSTALANPANGLTVPAAPTATDATSVADTSLTANWGASTGATKYYLDVSTVNTFASFVAGYENKDCSGDTNCAVSGLTDVTNYYYRVRAYNASGTSASSNTITTRTTNSAAILSENPAQAAAVLSAPLPTVLPHDDVSTTGFRTRWTVPEAATGMKLDVAIDAEFTEYVNGYEDLDVELGESCVLSGLSAETPYYCRVRAVSAGGTWPNSDVRQVTTNGTSSRPDVNRPDALRSAAGRPRANVSSDLSAHV